MTKEEWYSLNEGDNIIFCSRKKVTIRKIKEIWWTAGLNSGVRKSKCIILEGSERSYTTGDRNLFLTPQKND